MESSPEIALAEKDLEKFEMLKVRKSDSDGCWGGLYSRSDTVFKGGYLCWVGSSPRERVPAR